VSARKLRWLTPLGLLGLLGLLPGREVLYTLFGFLMFLDFFWVDERAQANLGRAATVAYLVTLVALAICLVVLIGVVKWQNAGDLAGALALAMAGIYGLHVLAFTLSYTYFDRRGV